MLPRLCKFSVSISQSNVLSGVDGFRSIRNSKLFSFVAEQLQHPLQLSHCIKQVNVSESSEDGNSIGTYSSFSAAHFETNTPSGAKHKDCY